MRVFETETLKHKTLKFRLENLIDLALGHDPWLRGVGETEKKGYDLSVLQSRAELEKFMETEHFLESSYF